MTKDQIKARLQELGDAVRFGGVSDAYAGAKLWENLIEGTGGGGAGGKVPNFIAFHPARVAEIARAVIERLDQAEQATVWALYCAGIHTLQAQAASLSIKLAALKQRRRKILVKLLDWFSPEARDLRREARIGADELAARARVEARDAELAKAVAAREARAKARIEARHENRRHRR